jgi:hypothetical protein
MTNKNSVTFETKVYENDWEYILKGNYLKYSISNNNYKFHKRIVLINNVKNIEKVKKYAQRKVKEGVIDAFYVVADFADEALTFFNIERESFKGGYYYSIAELVSIYLCETDFLLHYSSDSFIVKNDVNWIESAIKILNQRKDVLVANPAWNFKFDEAKKESIAEIEDFYLGYGFSDQCFLVRTNDFRQQIYNEKHIDSQRYPAYGGGLFEKRVDSYMRFNNKYRITYNKNSYISSNFPKIKNNVKKYFYRKYFLFKRLNTSK